MNRKFKLDNTPHSPAYMKGRIGVVQAFLDRPEWTQRAVKKAASIVYRSWWYQQEQDRPEWDDVLELARKLIDEWQRIDNAAPEGSLRHALTRPSRHSRARQLHGKFRQHERWLTGRIKRQIGYKECKTMTARRKWGAKLEKAIASDPFVARLRRWEKAIQTIENK